MRATADDSAKSATMEVVQSVRDVPVEVATYASGAPALMAALHGPLAVHRGCLVVGKQGQYALVVFRAQDVEWDGLTLTYEEMPYSVGDTVEFGGGKMPLHGLEGLHLPRGWADTEIAFVVAPAGP